MSRLLPIALVLIGAVAGGGAMLIADRVAPSALTDTDTARMGQVVREYVLANPEIIPEAMQRLQERESGKAVAANRAAIVTPYGSAFAGNPEGDVTLVEYFDYNCGYCRASLPMLTQLVKADPKLKIVFRELPVLTDTSRAAARVSLAAAQQGKFTAFHDALYAAGPVTDASIAGAARTAGVDAARIPDDADEQVRTNMTVAAKLGITGTPSWIVGDRVLSGALPIDRLQEAIAAARAKG